MDMTLDEAELAQPARAAAVAKIVVSAGFLIALFTMGGRYPMVYAGALFAPAAALTIARQLHGLTLTPRLRATRAALVVRTWDTAFLIPMVFVEERTIAWSELTGAKVDTLSVNGWATSTLQLSWVGGSIEIKAGVFAQSAHELQRRILDRHARGGEAPGKPASPIELTRAAGKRDRFQIPIVVRSQFPVVAAAITLAIAAITPIVGYLADIQCVLWGTFDLLAVIMVLGFRGRVRWIELRRDGVAIGPGPGSLAITPWEDVAHVKTQVTNGVPTSVRLTRRDGTSIVLHGKYDCALVELQRLLDPVP